MTLNGNTLGNTGSVGVSSGCVNVLKIAQSNSRVLTISDSTAKHVYEDGSDLGAVAATQSAQCIMSSSLIGSLRTVDAD